MSEDNDQKTATLEATEVIFNNAFFAALTGLAGRAQGQDPGTVVNEAYVLAERSAERFASGQPVMTDAQRATAALEAAQNLPTAPGQATVSGPNVTQVGGRFQRPGANP